MGLKEFRADPPPHRFTENRFVSNLNDLARDVAILCTEPGHAIAMGNERSGVSVGSGLRDLRRITHRGSREHLCLFRGLALTRSLTSGTSWMASAPARRGGLRSCSMTDGRGCLFTPIGGGMLKPAAGRGRSGQDPAPEATPRKTDSCRESRLAPDSARARAASSAELTRRRRSRRRHARSADSAGGCTCRHAVPGGPPPPGRTGSGCLHRFGRRRCRR